MWEHKAGKGNYHEGRISTRKKYNGEYETDFSGFVRFIGDAKEKVEKLSNEKHKIKILSCEVTNRYDKESGKEYFTFAIFDFELLDKNKNDSKDNNDSSPSVDLAGLTPDQISAVANLLKLQDFLGGKRQ